MYNNLKCGRILETLTLNKVSCEENRWDVLITCNIIRGMQVVSLLHKGGGGGNTSACISVVVLHTAASHIDLLIYIYRA